MPNRIPGGWAPVVEGPASGTLDLHRVEAYFGKKESPDKLLRKRGSDGLHSGVGLQLMSADHTRGYVFGAQITSKSDFNHKLETARGEYDRHGKKIVASFYDEPMQTGGFAWEAAK